jgi:hypothetical protein
MKTHIYNFQIAFTESTWYEGLYAMLFKAQSEIGKYYPRNADEDVNYPWGVHFNK